MYKLGFNKRFLVILSVFLCIFTIIGLCQQSDEITMLKETLGYLSAGGTFATNATGTKEFSLSESTGVKIIKTIGGNDGQPIITYEIITPPVDDFEYVIALDSSGSLGKGGNADQGDAVIYAIPRFINNILDNQIKDKKYQNKNFNISLISWDDNIDFAYSNFGNKDPKEAKLVPIKTAKNDIERYGTFDKILDLGDENENLGKFLGKYYVGEKEGTNLSLAIEASLEILNKTNNPININKRTHRFVILVTGATEFTKCSPALIRVARESNIPIYVIGLNINENSLLMANLEDISDFKNNTQRIKNIKAIGDQLKEYLLNALEDSLDRAILDPVAENVKIVDSFYNYIDPNNVGIIKIVDAPDSYNSPNSYKLNGNKSINKDKTKTIIFELPYKLLPNSITKIELNAAFDLRGLPVSITKNRRTLLFDPISNDTNTSHMDYLWTVNEKRAEYLSLPENQISITSTGIAATGKTNPKSGNGELGAITLLSFAILFMLLKPKN